MEQEKELLHDQTSWLKEELKAKTEEVLSLSRQKGNEILELKCSLENKQDEASTHVIQESWDIKKNKTTFFTFFTLDLINSFICFCPFQGIGSGAAGAYPVGEGRGQPRQVACLSQGSSIY